MSDVVVLGAGLVGLQTAMLLAEDGHRVAVLERDPTPPPLRIDRAWSDWSRPGVRQFGYAHFLMARWRAEADRHLPAITAALDELGALRANVFENHPLRRGRLRDGDEQFEILTARRPVIELAVARTADATPGVTVCRGVAAKGVVGTTDANGALHVTGVSTEGGIIGADLIVDCGGRQSSMPRWIREAGGPEVVETREDVGFRYYSRHFRSRDGRLPAGWGATAAPHDSLTVLTLPADNGTWSVVFTTSSEDRELRALKDTAVWDRVSRCFPRLRPWIDAEPLEDVKVMGALEDRHRAYVVHGRPLVTGMVPVGDSWTCTNPSLGRGVSTGLLHALALRTSLRAVAPSAPGALALRFAEETASTVEPIIGATTSIDHHRINELRSDRASMRYVSDDPRWLLSRALFAAAGKDDDALRAAISIVHLLASAQEALSDPDFAERVIELGADAVHRPPAGPSRADLLTTIGYASAA